MSKSDTTTEEARADTSKDRRDTIGMLARMAVRVTSGPFWQAVGVLLQDGVTKEAVEAEIYPGIGHYARPKQGANAESIVGYVGGPENPAIIATRDEDTRKRVAKIDQDETATFNTLALMHITKAGKILAYLAGHIADAVGLAKASELNNLRAFTVQQFAGAGHVHATPSGPTTATTPVVAPVATPTTDYPGTVVLKGQ